jgi:hypothetical protein
MNKDVDGKKRSWLFRDEPLNVPLIIFSIVVAVIIILGAYILYAHESKYECVVREIQLYELSDIELEILETSEPKKATLTFKNIIEEGLASPLKQVRYKTILDLCGVDYKR